MSDDDTILIKKYPNRRLYDTSSSKYVNLDEVARMIREGRNIRVTDSASEKDLTKDVMLQIIAESPYGKEFLTLDFLKSLITLGGETIREMYLKFTQEQSELAGKMQKLMWTGLETNPFMGVWAKLASDSGKEENKENPEETGGFLEEKDSEIRKLREKVTALQQSLKKARKRIKMPGKADKPQESD
ncbi:MAG: polyhydroxyalkanoate synthesis regulator DNA-binding domain-containing protein [Pseudomonadota bacterium]